MIRSIAPLAVALALAACSKPSGDASAPAQQAPATQTTPVAEVANTPEAQAETIFKSRCSTCHGMEGRGNGPGALTLSPKPRNYTDAKWQASVTDDHIREIIVKGGAAVGKSPNMVANPDLADKPDVVTALMKKVRSFAPPPAPSGAPSGAPSAAAPRDK